MSVSTLPRLTATEVEQLDPYALMAVLGKRVIYPGGRRLTEELLPRADLQSGQQVLDVGCGVGTTAIQIARRFGARDGRARCLMSCSSRKLSSICSRRLAGSRVEVVRLHQAQRSSRGRADENPVTGSLGRAG